MASYDTPVAIISAFIEGKPAPKRLASLIVAKDEVYSYGPHHPLVIRNERSFWVNQAKPSATTNRHRIAAELAMHQHGLTCIGYHDTLTETYAVYA